LRGAQGCDEGEQGEETPRRAARFPPPCWVWGGARAECGSVASVPVRRLGPSAFLGRSAVTGCDGDRVTLRLSSREQRWIPIRRLLVQATGAEGAGPGLVHGFPS